MGVCVCVCVHAGRGGRMTDKQRDAQRLHNTSLGPASIYPRKQWKKKWDSPPHSTGERQAPAQPSGLVRLPGKEHPGHLVPSVVTFPWRRVKNESVPSTPLLPGRARWGVKAPGLALLPDRRQAASLSLGTWRGLHTPGVSLPGGSTQEPERVL